MSTPVYELLVIELGHDPLLNAADLEPGTELDLEPEAELEVAPALDAVLERTLELAETEHAHRLVKAASRDDDRAGFGPLLPLEEPASSAGQDAGRRRGLRSSRAR